MTIRYFLFFTLYIIQLFAQVRKPVDWKFTFQTINDREIELYFDAFLQEENGRKWVIYSQIQDSDFGPIPLTFQLEPNSAFDLKGKVEEPAAKIKYEAVFDMEVKYFEDSVRFIQKIERKTSENFQINGSLNYQTCNGLMCLAPEDVDFSFDLPQTTIEIIEQKETLWSIFLAGLLGGFFALMTPCVFPMIPVTVAFFSQKKGIFKPVLYGFSIIFIYLSLGMAVTLLAGPDALNALASDAFFNLLFFAVFLIFALSFLGLFEISLPSSWLTKADKAAGGEGYGSIFWMAFTLALVSFSCTGPLIGTLLVEVAVHGGVIAPAIGMLGFGLALALPFTGFSIFPTFLQKIPRSGAWLNRVKVVLGFIEIALALKFLSVVDLAYHWDFLTREIFLAIWIALFLLLGLYLLGVFRFKHDDKLEYVPLSGFFLSLFAFAFCLYLLPGFWGAPLHLISGIAPPRTHSEDQFNFVKGNPTEYLSKNNEISIKYDHHLTENIEGLTIYKDYEQGRQIALTQKKPILLDFTGYACVNCRKMEDQVWMHPKVKQLLEQLVIISLYVDDKTKLAEQEQYVSSITGKKIKTIGNKWSDFQIAHYQTNAQPYYLILDPATEEKLHQPVGYLPDIEQFSLFLSSSIQKFNDKK